ncbi:MAG: hypothetical protein MI923_02650 [Phycisphaerales bacterium]|nr:hypothetical protein [Phycisphaerales bacterium]
MASATSRRGELALNAWAQRSWRSNLGVRRNTLFRDISFCTGGRFSD